MYKTGMGLSGTKDVAVGAGVRRGLRENGRLRWMAAAAFVLVGMVSVFVVPQYVPVSPSISDSYFFGYSNRTGVLLLLLCLAVGAFFSRYLRIHFSEAGGETRLPRRVIWLWMAIFAAGWAVMYVLVRGTQGFGESVYLLDRVKMLAAGLRPYRDFEFAYGALFLYGPRALMLLHWSAETSYFVWWLICLLSGVWLLARTVEMLDYPSGRKAEIFQMLCCFALPALLSTGLNYTLLRFVAAPYLALIVQRLDRRGDDRYRLYARGMCVVSTAILLVISPEMGLAFAAGSAVYLSLFGGWNKVVVGGHVAMLVAEAGLIESANRLEILGTLKAFSEGAFNFPIIPAGHILWFFFCCGITAVFVAHRLRGGLKGDGMLMVVAVSAPALFAALGRCDGGHVAFGGLGIVLVSMLLTSSFPRIWTGYRAVFLLLLVFLPVVTSLWNYRTMLSKVLFARIFQTEPRGSNTKLDEWIERAMRLGLGETKAKVKFAKLKSSSQSASELDPLASYPDHEVLLEAPFGYRPRGFGSYYSARIDGGYYDGLGNMFTVPGVDRKMKEMSTHPEKNLLLPDNYEEQCTVDMAAERKLILVLFVYPYRGRVRHWDSVWAPICTFIDEHYEKTFDLGEAGYGYGVWKQR